MTYVFEEVENIVRRMWKGWLQPPYSLFPTMFENILSSALKLRIFLFKVKTTFADSVDRS